MGNPKDKTHLGTELTKLSKYQKILYMDVGSWHSSENSEPVMTFGLVEHNAISLCTYYYDGKFANIPKKVENTNFKYDYENSLINSFLSYLMAYKYGDEYLIARQVSMKKTADLTKYHIKNIMPFPQKSLLKDENKLLILMPDLHLHYFKGSYLDNFITYYSNGYTSTYMRPTRYKYKIRTSMEHDFGNLLNTIIAFKNDPNINVTTVLLGDQYELWETNAVITIYCKLQENVINICLALKNFLDEDIKVDEGEMKTILNKLSHELGRTKEPPSDQILLNQINKLKKDQKLVDKLYISEYDSGEVMKEKAEYMKDKILEKYYDKNGKNFKELFNEIGISIITNGNHDNFLYLNNYDPLLSTILTNPKDYVKCNHATNPNYGHDKCDYYFDHGHNFDWFNNDEACSLGYLITNILVLFESKKRGDFLKELEGKVISDKETRDNTMRKVCKSMYYWDNHKNKIYVQAHTHKSYFEDITPMHFIYSTLKQSVERNPAPQKKKTWFEIIIHLLTCKLGWRNLNQIYCSL